MAANVYLRIVGQKQGEIRGSVSQRGREGEIAVIAMPHEIVSPRDPASGLPTGKRLHRPLMITKELDRASPPLHAAMAANENITGFALDFFSAQARGSVGTGVEVNAYTIALRNASVASIRTFTPDTHDPALARPATHEEIAFTYQQITWTWHDPQIVASDDWEAVV